MSHSPGPWEWQTSNSWRRLGSRASGLDGDVMYPTTQRDGHPDVTFPNGGFTGPDARLIAAAPDLLEALKRCVEAIYEYGRNEGEPTPQDEELFAAERAARAAIAKAEGPK